MLPNDPQSVVAKAPVQLPIALSEELTAAGSIVQPLPIGAHVISPHWAVRDDGSPTTPGIRREAVGQAESLVGEIDRLLRWRLPTTTATTTSSAVIDATSTTGAAEYCKVIKPVVAALAYSVAVVDATVKAQWVGGIQRVVGDVGISFQVCIPTRRRRTVA